MLASQVVLVVTTCLSMQETEREVSSILGWGRTPEEGMAIPFNILAWRIPWTEEPGGLQSMGHKVRHDPSELA